jgi:hypothetical protein
MLKALAVTAAFGVSLAVFSINAQALPRAASLTGVTEEQASTDNHMQQVRDGCGRHRRYSHRRGRCVWDE